jgi:GNAT superfamily N-acetyltransferase
MSASARPIGTIKIHPLTPSRWRDLVKLFGERGACGGCWCMYFRLPRAQWVAQKGDPNKQALRDLVQEGESTGLLAYADGEPVGWCALAPRVHYPRLANSRTHKPIDSQPAWAVTCFFVARQYRRQGLMLAMLEATAEYAARRGARLLEGYPSQAKKGYPDVFYYRGLVSTFRKAGFKVAARRSPASCIMRRALGSAPDE